jgi:hypothetical protein
MLSVQSKDPKVQDLQLEQKHLSISANLTAVDVVGGLKAASSEAAGLKFSLEASERTSGRWGPAKKQG